MATFRKPSGTGSPVVEEMTAHEEPSTVPKPWRLLFYQEIPAWQKDNDFILSGYRPTSASARTSLGSILYLNNQTVNVYSHLLGSILFALLPLYFYHKEYKHQAYARPSDLAVMSIYCLGVAICFAFSATFHILCNHSNDCSRFCNKLDYLGILVLMWGAGIPTIFYGFLCDSHLRLLYWTTTTAFALECTFLTLDPRFASTQYRPWRASLYAGFGLSSVIFVTHGLHLHGWKLQKSRMSLNYMIWMATSNLAGAAVYAARVGFPNWQSFRRAHVTDLVKIPERWIPYSLDIFGASHQIFHIAVIVAACIHYFGVAEAFRDIRTVSDWCNAASS